MSLVSPFCETSSILEIISIFNYAITSFINGDICAYLPEKQRISKTFLEFEQINIETLNVLFQMNITWENTRNIRIHINANYNKLFRC